MRYKANHYHPCFLPEHYREKLKQYQAEIDRGVAGQNDGTAIDDYRLMIEDCRLPNRSVEAWDEEGAEG